MTDRGVHGRLDPIRRSLSRRSFSRRSLSSCSNVSATNRSAADEESSAGDDHSDSEDSFFEFDVATLRLVSLRNDYSRSLLDRFYEEIMIPTFPLEDERDDVDDWVCGLDPDLRCDDDGVTMDVLVLICRPETPDGTDDQSRDDAKEEDGLIIVAGCAVEYYIRSNVGLVSYVVVSSDFRRLGVMSTLHGEAQRAVHRLAGLWNSKPRAVFAETNTADAGDVPPEAIEARHKALYRLGYRLLEFPYKQPPLAEDGNVFEHIVLLLYCGEPDKAKTEFQIDTSVIVEFVTDFYDSVFGYDKDDARKYERCEYYKLVKWFEARNSITAIHKDLPFYDVAVRFEDEMHKEAEQKFTPCGKYDDFDVVVVGGGAAGLAAALRLALELEERQQPAHIALLEASSSIGGRMRTYDTLQGHDQPFTADEKSAEELQRFKPWVVPLGAEFVHGSSSIINGIIEESGHTTKGTFELGSGLGVKICVGGRTREMGPAAETVEALVGDKQDYSLLLEKTKSIWSQLTENGVEYSSCAKEAESNETAFSDTTLSDFVERKMQGESQENIRVVKCLFDSIYAKTACTNLDRCGVNEMSREENEWDYGECNSRTNGCFLELIQHYLDSIGAIKSRFKAGDSCVDVVLSKESRVTVIESSEDADASETSRQISISLDGGISIACDRVIIAVPLAVLKQGSVRFRGRFALPSLKKVAIDGIDMFSAAKAHMLLSRGVDIENECGILEETELLFCPEDAFHQVWVRRDETSFLVTGFAPADGHEALMRRVRSGESAEVILLDQLRRIMLSYDGSSAFLSSPPSSSAFFLYDWSQDENILGAYSSLTFGTGRKECSVSEDRSYRTSRDDLAEPIRGRVFFAGEHANTKTCATVQAAIESGISAADAVLKSLTNGSSKRAYSTR